MFHTAEILAEFASFEPDMDLAMAKWGAERCAAKLEEVRLNRVMHPANYTANKRRASAVRRTKVATDPSYRKQLADKQRTRRDTDAGRAARREYQRRWRAARRAGG